MFSTKVQNRFGKALLCFLCSMTFTLADVSLLEAESSLNVVTELMNAVRNGETETVNRLLKNGGEDVNAQDEQGWSALFYAIYRGDAAMVQKLLDRGADVNLQDRDGATPLIAAIIGAHRTNEIALAVIQKRVDPNRADKHGNTPLIYAVVFDRESLLDALLAKGADPNHADEHGCTPLLFANDPNKAFTWLAPDVAFALPSLSRLLPLPKLAPGVMEIAVKEAGERMSRIAEKLKAAGALLPDGGAVASGHHTIDSVPRPLGRPNPIRAEALSAVPKGFKGRYYVLLLVNPEGLVERVRVVRGVSKSFNEQVEKNALAFRFQPAMKNGKPTPCWFMMEGDVESRAGGPAPWRPTPVPGSRF